MHSSDFIGFGMIKIDSEFEDCDSDFESLIFDHHWIIYVVELLRDDIFDYFAAFDGDKH